MSKIEDPKEPSLYHDFGGFKGDLFQANINSINKLYYGQGLKFSDVPFIFRKEKDKKYYLSSNKFKICSKNDGKIKFLYFPDNFLNQVFYYDKLLFFVSPSYKLLVFKIDKTSCIKYVFNPKSREKKTTKKKEEIPNNEEENKKIHIK